MDDQDNVTGLVVGAPFPLPLPGLVHGAAYGGYFDAPSLLLVNWCPAPSREEAEAYARGRGRFALTIYSDTLLFLAYRFGNLGWSDVPHSASIEPEHLRHYTWATREHQPGRHLLVTSVLVDSADLRTVGLRMFTFDAVFTRVLVRAVRQQALRTISRVQLQQEIDAAYRLYTTPRTIARAALITTSSGA